MQYSQIPAALTKAFAASGDKNTIPTDANSSTLANGLAAFSSGFPPVTSLPASAGGQNPVREDFNGVLGMLTTIHQWQMTGAARKYESAFSTAIGGYPSFSVLVKSSGSGFWISTADNNTTDPDSVGSANWKDLSAFLTGSFIDKLPTGTVDAMVASITLPTLDASFAGVPGFVRAIGANTSTTPTYSGKTIVKGAGAALVAGDIAGAGHWIELQYDLALDKWVLLNPATGVSAAAGVSIQGAFRNLKIDALGVNNHSCIITADEVVLEDSANVFLTVRAVNKTVNANGAVGAPLSIMSARAASTWYYRWLWYNATNGLTATLDISDTAPTPPTGYAGTDYKAKLPGACRTDSSGSTYLLQIKTRDHRSGYVPLAGSNLASLPVMSGGVQGSVTTPTYVSVATGSFVPPAAFSINVLPAVLNAGAIAVVAPSGAYGSYNSATNTPPISLANASGSLVSVPTSLLLESTNIYWASNTANNNLYCFGWED